MSSYVVPLWYIGDPTTHPWFLQYKETFIESRISIRDLVVAALSFLIFPVIFILLEVCIVPALLTTSDVSFDLPEIAKSPLDEINPLSSDFILTLLAWKIGIFIVIENLCSYVLSPHPVSQLSFISSV